MEITNEQLPWDSDDTLVWQNFLSTRTGQRLIPKMVESVPELHSSGDSNAILIRSGEVRGFQEATRALLTLANPPKDVQSDPATNYPPLEDDSKWQDGHKITQ